MVEVYFLCVHKKLRSKHMAPVLIREITRRVQQQGLYQAVYRAGVVLPTPVTSCRYEALLVSLMLHWISLNCCSCHATRQHNTLLFCIRALTDTHGWLVLLYLRVRNSNATPPTQPALFSRLWAMIVHIAVVIGTHNLLIIGNALFCCTTCEQCATFLFLSGLFKRTLRSLCWMEYMFQNICREFISMWSLGAEWASKTALNLFSNRPTKQ